MKITDIGYPLTQLPGGETLKKPSVRAQKGPADLVVDVPVLSDVPEKAIIKYLKVIDEIASDPIHATDDDIAVTGNEEGAALKALQTEAQQQKGAALLQKILVYVRGVASAGKEGGNMTGELIIIKDVLSFGAAGTTEEQKERAMTGLSNGVAPELPRMDAGMGTRIDKLDSTGIGDKFNISLDPEQTGPAVSVMRQGPSGKMELLNNGENRIDQGNVIAVVRRLSAALAGEAIKAPPTDAAKPDGVEGKGQVTFAGGNYPSGVIPGATVRFVGMATTPVCGTTMVGTGNRGGEIAEKLVSLADAVNELIGSQTDVEGVTGDDQAPAVKMLTSVKETMTVAAKEALRAAIRHAEGDTADVNEGSFGMRLDEKGMLRVDKTVFTESLSGRKEETMRFVHDFEGAFHDRITYNFHPFAGLYAGEQGNRNLRGPGNKEAVADKGSSEKAKFEKRFKELQMLLKNSYELKESFVKRKFAGGDGRDEEAR